MFCRRALPLVPVLLLSVTCLSGRVRAETVLTNLTNTSANSEYDTYLGQAFTTGSKSEILQDALLQFVAPEANSGVKLELEAYGTGGTVGSTLFSDFTTSYNATTGVGTFTANSVYTLAANTSYYLVASDPTIAGKDVSWYDAKNNTVTAAEGYTIPATGYSNFASSTDNSGQYSYTSTQETLLFQLDVVSVPEPSSLMLCGVAGMISLALGRARLRPRSPAL